MLLYGICRSTWNFVVVEVMLEVQWTNKRITFTVSGCVAMSRWLCNVMLMLLKNLFVVRCLLFYCTVNFLHQTLLIMYYSCYICRKTDFTLVLSKLVCCRTLVAFGSTLLQHRCYFCQYYIVIVNVQTGSSVYTTKYIALTRCDVYCTALYHGMILVF